VGSYAYADGGTHVRVVAAADALAVHLHQHRQDTSVASLATPTDVCAVPAEAVDHSVRAYQRRGGRPPPGGGGTPPPRAPTAIPEATRLLSASCAATAATPANTQPASA
jgi:hypothetical protein